MEEIYNAQAELFSVMEKLYVNMKKDGPERKSSTTYFDRKSETLESYWVEYQNNHKKLLQFEDKQRPYFARKEYEIAERLYKEVKSYMTRESAQALPRTPIPYDRSEVSGASKSGFSYQEAREEAKARDKEAEESSYKRSTGSSSKLDEMLHKQAVNFKAFMRTVNSIDVSSIAEKWKFEDALKQVQSRWSVIDSLHWEIDGILDGDNDDYEISFTHHETIFNNLKEAINTKLWSVSHREHITPQVDIPIFTGNYHQWVSFKNLFTEAVHLNPSLSQAQKMQYLKGKIRGDAERLIQHLQISSENYSTCWEILNHRYENKKLIFSSHLNIILSLPNMQQQSLLLIKKMHDATKESLNAIKNLGLDISSWDPIIVHILTQKLDHETHSDYVESLKQPRELPILQELLDYLESKFTMLEQSKRKQDIVVQKPAYQNANNYGSVPRKSQFMTYNVNNRNNYVNNSSNQYPNRHFPRPLHKSYHASSSNMKCPLCNLEHGIFNCASFLEQSNELKLKTLKRLDICKNCLYSHYGKPCFSISRCRICSGCHNTLIHDAMSQRPLTSGQPIPKSKPFFRNQQNTNGGNSSHVSQKTASEILLSTAMVKVKALDGTYKVMRALIDQGSQISLITEHGAQQLGLRREQCRGVIFGVGQNENNCKGKLNVSISSLYNDFSLQVEVFIMNQLIKNLPNSSFAKPKWDYINNINLADPEFYISRPVDLLLGADVYSVIMLEGFIKGKNHYQPLAQQTQLGWLLCGGVQAFQCNVVLTQIEEIHKFWEIEEISGSTEISAEDQKCIEIYNNTTKRQSDGRYEVRIPMKENFENELGSSKMLAIAQFKNMEKKFAKQPELSKQYLEFINEYISLQHMKESNSNPGIECFLPHHAVLREDSSTTKLRVVFNASAKTSSGNSLNDLMCKGPNLQQDLQALILKWRQYRYAYTADIKMMYRQILVSEEDQSVQKIIWRESPSQPLKEYFLRTVTYGMKAAPFLAMMTLKRLASDERENFPTASRIAESAFFMDDLIYGCHSIEVGQQEIIQLNQLLESGGFTLRKWASNNMQLLENIPKKNADGDVFTFKLDNTSKTLGLRWNSNQDKFLFDYNIKFQSATKITKRMLLAEISKVFDPLGWIAPVVTKLKLLFQSVWQEKLKWEDVLAEKTQSEWFKLKDDITNIKHIEMPRWIGTTEEAIIELHGYCDASMKAYAAVVYARIKNGSTYSVILIAAKTKLVPLNKTVSLPRLELCGAHLLAQLTKKVMECYNNYQIKLYGWCDSMVVLGWLQGEENRWKPFVANRVSQIKEIIPADHWNYVKTKENPADAASRGLSFSQLKDHNLWWTGPSYLSEQCEVKQQNLNYSTNQEVKKSCNIIIQSEDNNIINQLLQNHNSISKIILILAWIIRALTPCRVGRPTYITLQEINAAKLRIIRHVQLTEFQSDIDNLKKYNCVKSNSKILSLQPFIDSDGILRVGGRLRNTNLPFEAKHPIIIPHNHRLAYLLIEQAHLLTYHGGVKMTLSTLRRKFWVISGTNATKKQLRNCVTCRKNKPELKAQMMGDLPEYRCNPAPPFYHTGVDYTGFVDIKYNRGRGAKTTKGYIAVFICMVTKAVHIELVSDLSSEAFLAALRRMAARKGAPRHLYSDNGTNFVKANRVLQEDQYQLEQIFDDTFLKEITEMSIEWHFNAPAWPTAGGLWERTMRSLKHHMKRVIGLQKLTFEEYTTLLTQVEACLNSRPLCALTENIEDLECLTPAHFLTGRAGVTVIETATDARTRWHLVTKLFNDLWKQWKTEYLTQLSVRSKWHKTRENIKKGDIVLIHEENLPAGKWAMGRVVELHPGSDGLVRVVSLKTKNGQTKRPLTKISLLPISNASENINNNSSAKNNKTSEEIISENKEKSIKRSNQKNSFITMAISYLLFMSILTTSNAAFSLTKFTNNNQSIYFDSVIDMQLIRDEWTMVTFYNMSPYWEGLETVGKCLNYLQRVCSILPDQSRCNMILTQLQHDHMELRYYNELLHNQAFNSRNGLHSRQRRGLFNGVGYAARGLFGMLDERFAEKYKQDIRLLKENDKHIHALYKNQTSVIEAQYNLLKRTEEMINTQHKTINQRLNKLDAVVNNITNQINKCSIIEEFTLTSITTSHILTNLRRTQDNLLTTLMDTYHGRFNIHLLSPEQFRKELQIISSHLSKDLTLPLENIASNYQDIYKLISVKSRMTAEYFIFEIKFPLVNRDYYQLYKLIPIPHKINNRMITIVPKASYVAINLQKDAFIETNRYEIQNCLHHETVYLCKLFSPIKHLGTEERFCQLNDVGVCEARISTCKDDWFELTKPSTYLYFHCDLYAMRIMCENEIQTVNLVEAGLIRLDDKCIAKGKDFTFYATQQQSNIMHMTPDIEYKFEIAPINNLLNLTLPSNYDEPSDPSTNFTNSLSDLRDKIDSLKQDKLEIDDEDDDELSVHDIHQYIISYAGVAGAVVLAVLIWWRRRRGVRAGHAQQQQQSSVNDSEVVSVSVLSARKQSTADRQPSVSVLSERQQSMVDIATSPIITKRVYIDTDESQL